MCLLREDQGNRLQGAGVAVDIAHRAAEAHTRGGKVVDDACFAQQIEQPVHGAVASFGLQIGTLQQMAQDEGIALGE